MDEKVIDMILDAQKELREDLHNLDEKIDEILEWKWKVIGGAMAISGLVTILFQTLFHK